MSNIIKTASAQDIEIAYVADYLQRTGRKVTVQSNCVEVVAETKAFGFGQNKNGSIVTKRKISNMEQAQAFVLGLNP